MSGKSGTKKGGGLGRGLDILFEDSMINDEVSVDDRENKTISFIRVSDIFPNSAQPRKKFDEAKLNALSDSIKEHGLLQPIIVRPHASRYEIVAGERRWRASKIAGLDEVPCIVHDFTDRENMLMALIENMQREDLNPLEEANAFHEMMNMYGLTHEEISKTVGRSRPYITNSLRLLKLPQEIQDMVASGGLTGGHARALAGVDDDNEQLRFAKICIDKKLSVRQLEKMISNSESRSAKKGRTRDPEIKAAEEHLTKIVGGRVSLPSSRKKGKIEIHFSSPEQLDSIIEKLSELDEKEFE
ncbi:MAG: ParB/RepB/Spo0J family partition protein [Eubacteriales bacterium]|nr:ParB/RepB/Spo0J family partition protein [Eubacteriales bacterium]